MCGVNVRNVRQNLGFRDSKFYRFRLLVFRLLEIPTISIPGFRDSGF